MSIKKWLRNQAAALAISVSKVEKNAFGQTGKDLVDEVKSERTHGQGTLADSLKKGEVTQEVRDLRWRMYKVLTKMESHDMLKMKNEIEIVKTDDHDPYQIELIFNNKESTRSISDAINNDLEDVTGDGTTIGEISGENYFRFMKTERPLLIIRETMPRFDIEKYTKKLIVRKLKEDERLLEFYVSKYPNDNINSKLFIKEIKEVIELGPRNYNFLEIKEVGFISDNSTIGVNERLQFGYEITSFNKIIEFDGNYVIKFNGKVIVNGVNIVEQYREDELDKKYENKEVRKLKR